MPTFINEDYYQLPVVPEYIAPEPDDEEIAERVELEIAYLERLRESYLENGQFAKAEELAIKIAELEDSLPDC